MAAPFGNKFWELRTTIGRAKLFESPETLWKACCQYFEATQNRTWDEKDWVGKDAMQVTRNHKTPFTIHSLCLFLDIDRQTWLNYGEKKGYEAFFDVVTRVNDIIFAQKFEGAATGFFNPSIVAMELGLKSKIESDNTHKVEGFILERTVTDGQSNT